MGKSVSAFIPLKRKLNSFRGLNRSTGKNIGIYPEIKAPWFHHQEGKILPRNAGSAEKKYGCTGKQDNVYLQCFDVVELKRIKNELEPKMGWMSQSGSTCAYTDWNEAQQKQPDGRWVKNYNYDWMFKPGAMKADDSMRGRYWSGHHMLVAEGSTKGMSS